MRYLKLCLLCRGKLVPRATDVVGAWWCRRCEQAFTQAEVEQCVDNQPGGVTVLGRRER